MLRARIVQVAFLSPCCTNGAASTTNRFLQSCAWQYLFSADFLWIVTHTDSTYLVDDLARCFQPVIGVGPLFWAVYSTHIVQYLLKGILHVLGLVYLVVRPGVVETQHRDAEFINHAYRLSRNSYRRGNGGTAAGHAYLRAKKAAVIIFKRCAVATGFFQVCHPCPAPGRSFYACRKPKPYDGMCKPPPYSIWYPRGKLSFLLSSHHGE
jgi:hypothetical protein